MEMLETVEKIMKEQKIKVTPEPSLSIDKKTVALRFSLEGGKGTSTGHIKDDRSILDIMRSCRDGEDVSSMEVELAGYYGCIQEEGESISDFIERIKRVVGEITPQSEEEREELMRDLLMYGMLSNEGKNKIRAKNAGWEEAREIAQEDEDEICNNAFAKEIYEYAIREEKEKEEKEKEKREKEEKKTERERKVAQKTKDQIAKVPDPEQEKEKFRFNSLDLLSLFVTMTLKRIVNNEMKPKEHFDFLLKIIEDNLERMNIVDREWLFDTLRDHARMYRREWSRCDAEIPRSSSKPKGKDRLKKGKKEVENRDEGRILYNTYLMVLSLKLGLKKPWVPEGFTNFNSKVLKRELANLYGKDPPNLALRQLNQNYPCFDFLFPLCSDMEQVFLQRGDEAILSKCFTLKNLRILEFHGNVTEKFIYHGLWGVKKCNKVMEMALTDPSEFTITLPQLEVIRFNVYEGYRQCIWKRVTSPTARGNLLLPVSDFLMQQNTLPVTFGAAALVIQPNLNVVENRGSWDTADAILCLLDQEALLKKNKVQLGLRKILLDCQTKLDFEKLKKATQLCPKLRSVAIRNYHPLPTLPLSIIKVLPMQNIEQLNLHVAHMPARDLIRLLDTARSLKVLTLILDPRCPLISDIANGFLQLNQTDEMLLFPTLVRELTLDFTRDSFYDGRSIASVAWNSEEMMAFLHLFPAITTLHLHKTMSLPPALLVYGCLGGALACLAHLRHLSLVLCHRDLPHEKCMLGDIQESVDLHCRVASSLMPDLQAKATFPHLAALKTFEIDELYLCPCVDRFLEALRVEGVNISTVYRSSLSSFYGRYDAAMVDFPPPY